MSRKTLLVCTFTLVLACATARAQYSQHSFGVRIGNQIAADYLVYFSPYHALNVNLGVVNAFVPSYQFMLVSAAWHYNFYTSVRGLTPYTGAGLSTGVQFGHWNTQESSRITYFLSLDVPLGVEYTLSTKPVVFFFEWSPKVQLAMYRRLIPHSVSVGVRFVLPNVRYSRR